jgi:hypothetical protein
VKARAAAKFPGPIDFSLLVRKVNLIISHHGPFLWGVESWLGIIQGQGVVGM